MTATVVELEINVLENVTKKIRVPAGIRVLAPGENCDAKLVFRIINQKDGDKRLVWDSEEWNQIRDAKELFDQLIEQGMVPYLVDPSGKKSPQIMMEFDPFAEEVIMAERREIVVTPQKLLAGG